MILFLILKNFYPETLNEHRTGFDIFLLVRATIRLSVAWFMLWQFKSLFSFFLTIKKKKLRKRGLSNFNTAVIFCISILWLLGVIDSFNTTFIFALD